MYFEKEHNSRERYPEFLSIFSNTGDFQVRVKLIKYEIAGAGVANQTMTAAETIKLIDSRTGTFFDKMFFDDHLLSIDKFKFDLIKKRIEITAKPIDVI